MPISRYEDDELIERRKQKLMEDFDKDEEGLEEQGLEDYVMPVKRALQSGGKAAVMMAVKQKMKVKPPKDTGTTIKYDKPFGGNPSVSHDKPLPGAKPVAKKDDKEWLKKLLED